MIKSLRILLPVATIAAALYAAFTLVGQADRAPSSTLSQRINAACPPGYEPVDWEVDGEFTNIPPDTVRVTCANWKSSTRPTIYRSVQR